MSYALTLRLNSHLRALAALALIIFLQACGNEFKTSDPYKVSASFTAVHGKPGPMYGKYVEAFKNQRPFSKKDLDEVIENYDQNHQQSDSIDHFLSLLPESYRSKFTLVHRSYSIQKGTPLSPRVILFGQDASVMMTFNAGVDHNGKKMRGGEAIEVISFNSQKLRWDFSEITFSDKKEIQVKKNPKKCIMCHSGTPKAITYDDAKYYENHLKPIFPQYPFWPGFYGSVNDIVGIDGTIDTVMNDTDKTMRHVKSLTFSDTEELFRLSSHLEDNPKYLELVKNEEEVHKNNFLPFMNSIKSRKRYQHLRTLKDLYLEKGEEVPEFLKSAPYRRTFDKEYGHYLFRPNFYLSSLMTFYHSQVVASEIMKFPQATSFQKSLIANKFNCSIPSEKEPMIEKLRPSFDLVYPNLTSQKAMDKQYLLSYQYNLVASGRGTLKENQSHLPLFAWNLESNEEIASYHYGNVYSDLNELVLWRLASQIYPEEIDFEKGRDAAQQRHYALPDNSLQKILRKAGGIVSRFTTSQMSFANSVNPFYGSQRAFKAQPVSNKCNSVFTPGAIAEMEKLSLLETLPHQVYPIHELLSGVVVLKGEETKLHSTQNIRHNCESCHSSSTLNPQIESHIWPQFNVDWYSADFAKELKRPINDFEWFEESKVNSAIDRDNHKDFAQHYLDAISLENLPVPYGSRMPFGRRAITGLAKTCEEELVKRNFSASQSLKFKVFACTKEEPDSLDCACKKWAKNKWAAYKAFYLP